MPFLSTPVALAILLLAAPLFGFGFAGERCVRAVARLPLAVRLTLPATLAIPYLIVALAAHTFQARWLVLYLPVSYTHLTLPTN